MTGISRNIAQNHKEKMPSFHLRGFLSIYASRGTSSSTDFTAADLSQSSIRVVSGKCSIIALAG
jgi:hypothetical protein